MIYLVSVLQQKTLFHLFVVVTILKNIQKLSLQITIPSYTRLSHHFIIPHHFRITLLTGNVIPAFSSLAVF